MYTTVSNVFLTVPAIGSMSNMTSASVATFIGYSDAEINAKLAGAYTVPVSGSVPLLEVISTDMTVERILSRRAFTGEKVNKSDWVDRFKQARELLDAVAQGKTALLYEDGSRVAESAYSGPWSSTTNYTPTFDVDGMENSVVDPSRIDSIRGAKE